MSPRGKGRPARETNAALRSGSAAFALDLQIRVGGVAKAAAHEVDGRDGHVHEDARAGQRQRGE